MLVLDLIMPMIIGAGFAIVVILVLLAWAEERAEGRERAEMDATPGRHSMEIVTRRIQPTHPRRDFMLDTGEGLVRPYMDSETNEPVDD